jgi:hypothetical protein
MALIWNDDFSTDKSWTGYGGLAVWERGVPAQSPVTSAFTGSNVIATDLNANYANDINTMLYITTPNIDCSNYTSVTISFRRFANFENDSDYDSFYVEVYDGSTWQRIWNSEDTATEINDASWTLQEPSISTYGDSNSTFKIRYGIRTDYTENKRGWFIDDVRVNGTPTSPNITNVDSDNDVYITQTNTTITGTNFVADGTNSRVRINSSSAGTGTDQVQTDTSWSDTSIDFTVSKGSLNYGTNYLFVRNNDSNENATGHSINLYILHSISSTDKTGNKFRSGDTVTLSGVNFGSSQDTGEQVQLMNTLDGTDVNIDQTVTSWSNTSITFTVVQSTLDEDDNIYLSVLRNDSSLGDSSIRRCTGFLVDLLPPVEFIYSLSSQIAQNESTTRQLTEQENSFISGKIGESDNPEITNLKALQYTEIEFCFKPTNDISSGQQYDFRVIDINQAGEKLASYNKQIKLTISV